MLRRGSSASHVNCRTVRQERKLVTVLFADIVGSSESVRGHDAEVVRESLARTFATASRILTSHGATVEKFIGDAVMAVFGVPATHEDDAERALRAAQELRDASSREGARPGLGFTLRIGVNSGEVVAGEGQQGDFLVTGQPVIVAARLEQSAAPGEILVGPLTRTLAGPAARFGDARTIDAKGLDGIDAAPLLAIGREHSRVSAAAPLIGRDAELDRLLSLYARCAETARPHLVSMVGSPGIGKSRLANELMLRIAPAPAVRAACLPYGHMVTFWPLQELMRAHAGILPSDGREVARGKIDRAVEAAIADRAAANAVSRDLAELVLGHDQLDAGDRGPTDRRADLAAAVGALVSASLTSAPATIVLEDLQWAEDPMLDVVEDVLDRVRGPLFLVCLSRPELLERRPSWGRDRADAFTIALEPLGPADSRRLAAELLGGRGHPRLEEVADATEGNPLFLEEYIRLLVEGPSGAAIPPTLHEIVAARLDATSRDTKRLLQEGSVLGREFWVDALLSGGATPGSVAEAERRELVLQTSAPGPSGTATYRFRHGVIRDVAYASLSKSDRSRAHSHHVEWLRAVAGERGQEYVDITAYHASRAYDLAREVDAPDVERLGRAAFEAVMASAAAAAGRSEFAAALPLYDRAVAIADEIGLDRSLAVVAQATAAITRHRLEASPEAAAEVERAIEAARGLGPSEHLVRLLIWQASSITISKDVIASRALFAEAVAVARQLEVPRMISYAEWAACEPDGIVGDLRGQAACLESALASIRAAGADQWLVSCLTEVSATAVARGDLVTAGQRAGEAVALAQAAGQRLERFKAADCLARYLVAAGAEGALPAAIEARALASEIGGPWALAQASEVLALAREAAGQIGEARHSVEEGLAQLDPVRMPTQREAISRLEALRSRCALAAGDLAAAHEAAERAVALAPRTHVAVRAMALAAAAEVAAAEGQLGRAGELRTRASELLGPTQHEALKRRIGAYGSAPTVPVTS